MCNHGGVNFSQGLDEPTACFLAAGSWVSDGKRRQWGRAGHGAGKPSEGPVHCCGQRGGAQMCSARRLLPALSQRRG